MRLSKIKLSGFKTFVDPTTLALPSNLVGIVGPNGCGKSNVIDAVRWVLGESSAKYLRGESMADVIFNGSSSRKPVSTASIELFFDNSQKKIGGEYSKYNEISTKRIISRDGQSQYFLNGTKCRRKDVTGLFLGTGLGPRSYAIVQQDTISRLIEAKPEDIRIFLEEASGISKYKQKRKETESRIKNTKENLSRLNDLRDEIVKQIKRLKSQANAAKRYKKYKSREKDIHAEILFTKINNLLSELTNKGEESKQYQNQYDQQLTGLRKIEADIEDQRVIDSQANQKYNDFQQQHFELQSKIARLEQSIEYEKELESQKNVNVQEINKELKRIESEYTEDSQKIKEISSDLIKLDEAITTKAQNINNLKKTLSQTESNIQSVDTNNESVKEEIGQLNTIVETEAVKIKVLSDQMRQREGQKKVIKNLHGIETNFNALVREIDQLEEILEKTYIDNKDNIFQALTNRLQTLEGKIEFLSANFKTIEDEIIQNEKQIQSSSQNLETAQGKLDHLIQQKRQLDEQKQDLSNQANKQKQKLNNLIPLLQEEELNAESNRSTISALNNAMNRLESQRIQYKTKSLEITKPTAEKIDSKKEGRAKLENLLNQSLESEQTLNTFREELEKSQSVLRDYEIDRTNKNSEVNLSRESLEKYKLSIRELEVRKEGMDEQLKESGYDFQTMKEKFQKVIDEAELSNELEKILSSIEKLGPINLAASNEHEEANERKENLDSQFDDLNRALETLNGAINKIDDESMKRFSNTFEKINASLENYFPKLFDGGKAYLELENNDSLNGGVVVMARPPGKRNSNIHLLSGGEKALTAVALLFSIFELNPAPFCLLDEVDAPLDDTNVGRFCEIVRSMSSNVQFVVVTHNKSTMELTNQLIGVSMSEPGVSRLVSVDLDEAVALTDEIET
ncbi:MAG TPA: AAA family ATPase [Gammaproteobacteria bacterium]|jgi:chromosome segregation protein|nr:AAA family ATPase [Gammaproteobacteria bacterium]